MARSPQARGDRSYSAAIASKADAAVRRASALRQRLAPANVLARDRRADHVGLACRHENKERTRSQGTRTLFPDRGAKVRGEHNSRSERNRELERPRLKFGALAKAVATNLDRTTWGCSSRRNDAGSGVGSRSSCRGRSRMGRGQRHRSRSHSRRRRCNPRRPGSFAGGGTFRGDRQIRLIFRRSGCLA